MRVICFFMILTFLFLGMGFVALQDIDPDRQPIAYKVTGGVLVILIIFLLFGLSFVAVQAVKGVDITETGQEINSISKEIKQLNENIEHYLTTVTKDYK